MARGTDQMQAGRLADSIAIFSEVIKRKPDFAEGWNRRATVHYRRGEYQKSIADCDEVLKAQSAAFRRTVGPGPDLFQARGLRALARLVPPRARGHPNMLGVEINIQGIEELLKDQRPPLN